jgi:hypothetical protein
LSVVGVETQYELRGKLIHLERGPQPGQRLVGDAFRRSVAEAWVSTATSRCTVGAERYPAAAAGISPQDFDAAVTAGRIAVAGERDPWTAASHPIAVALMLDPE